MHSRHPSTPTCSSDNDLANRTDRNSFLQNHKLSYIRKIASMFLSAVSYFPYPENLSGDVCYPVFFQSIPFRVLHEVRDRACSTKLHNKLQKKYQHAINIKHSFQLSSSNPKLKQAHSFSLRYAWHIKEKIQKCYARLGIGPHCLHPFLSYSPSPIPKLRYETIHSNMLKHKSIHSFGL